VILKDTSLKVSVGDDQLVSGRPRRGCDEHIRSRQVVPIIENVVLKARGFERDGFVQVEGFDVGKFLPNAVNVRTAGAEPAADELVDADSRCVPGTPLVQIFDDLLVSALVLDNRGRIEKHYRSRPSRTTFITSFASSSESVPGVIPSLLSEIIR